MPFELARAHQRYLRLVGQRRPRSDAEVTPPTQVEIAEQPRAFFRQALEAGGAYIGGALFGRLYDGVLTVDYALPNGYVGWQAPEHNPLQLDERYLLGVTDALRASRETPIDWIGNWLIFPDSGLPGQTEAITWFDQASATKLVDNERCLLMVGWEEGRLSACAYVTGEHRSQIVALPHNLGGTPNVIAL